VTHIEKKWPVAYGSIRVCNKSLDDHGQLCEEIRALEKLIESEEEAIKEKPGD
jgi:hypothetical protein